MKVTSRLASSVTAAAVAIGLCLGVAAVANADNEPRPTQPKSVDQAMGDLTPSWPTNKFGLTVGTPTMTDADAGNLPDLAPAATDSGKGGYLRAEDVFLPEPKTPDEAVAQMKKLLNDKGELIATVYGPDGKTVLGVQTVTTVTEGNLNDLP